MAIDVPEYLVSLEAAAWADLQAGDLSAARASAGAVQAAITAHAASAGVGRYGLEMAVKRAVRHA